MIGPAPVASYGTLYRSQAWEDDELLKRALAIGGEDDVLSVCGGGCSVLSLLLEQPRSIVAIDANPAQTALLELKLVALTRLSQPEFAAFLGALPADDREATYHHLRAGLGDQARAYWDEHPLEIYHGVLGCGMLDQHIRGFAERCVLPRVDHETLAEFLALSDPRRQRIMFERHLAVLEQPMREWFGAERLAAFAPGPVALEVAEQVDHGAALWRRFAEVATMLPARSNFYLQWLLTGRYLNLHTGPTYLRPVNFERLRALCSRITIVRSDLAAFLERGPARPFAAVNLSNLREHVPAQRSGRLMALLSAHVRPGGRIAYWSGTTERRGDRTRGVQPVLGLGDQLCLEDRAPLAEAFHVDEPLSGALSAFA
jgi:S-adenosylmethionine-diacylglycerol 3-amino-3-carboxypropyl transferase